MSAADAARKLADALRGAQWLLSIGVGQDQGKETIFVYVKKNPPKNVPALLAVAHDFPVIVRRSGPLKTAVAK